MRRCGRDILIASSNTTEHNENTFPFETPLSINWAQKAMLTTNKN